MAHHKRRRPKQQRARPLPCRCCYARRDEERMKGKVPPCDRRRPSAPDLRFIRRGIDLVDTDPMAEHLRMEWEEEREERLRDLYCSDEIEDFARYLDDRRPITAPSL